jgi:hypothetical protein
VAEQLRGIDMEPSKRRDGVAPGSAPDVVARVEKAIRSGFNHNRDIDCHENSFEQLMSDIMHCVRAALFETPKSEPNLEPSNLFDVESVSTDDTDFNRIRDLAFLAIRKHVPCDKPPLIYGCERAECICAEAACDVAGAVSYALSAELARVRREALEEAAKVADAEASRYPDYDQFSHQAAALNSATQIAHAIRALGSPKP